MKFTLVLLLVFSSFGVWAEGACPQGQYPVGGQGVQGCAPIPGAGGGGGATSTPRPTGKWETRWGALAEGGGGDRRGVALVTGVAESRKTKREASKVALQQCENGGGLKCKVIATYYNQCIAVVDPKGESEGVLTGKSVIYMAQTLEIATAEALKGCSPTMPGACAVSYSACSMSEFRAFK
jgi:hypothetical protein